MTNDSASENLRSVWQGQTTEAIQLAPEMLDRKLRRLQRGISRRNVREYCAVVFVVAAFAYYEWKFPTILLRIGSGLVIGGALFTAYELHRRASARQAPVDMARNTCLDYYISELVRQRDALRAVWVWYLLPFVPGLCVFLFGLTRFTVAGAQSAFHPISRQVAAVFFAGCAAFVGLVFFAVFKINQWAATKLQSQIDELVALKHEP